MDDTVISGKVKPVLALARHAREHRGASRPLELSMLTFVRSQDDPDFVRALRAEGFAIDVVRERRRFDFQVFPQLREIVARRQPHVLWTHGAKTHFLVRAAQLHRGRAWVALHHGYTATSLTWTLYDQLDRWSLRGADRVMTACEAFAVDLNRRLGIPRERLSVHRSPIAARGSPRTRSHAESLRRELGLGADARIVLSVGRLSKEKAYGDLIQAMARVKRAVSKSVLVVVGEGPELSALERLCARLDTSSDVRFVGYKNDVSPYYDAADVFALTSHTEGTPNVLLEAMDAEVPIVTTAVGGVPEMITHREHGLLVPRGDIEGIASAIVELLSDAGLRRTLASSAQRTLAEYSFERYYAKVQALFDAAAPALIR
ncbi:MAG: glycosyltransferase [Candidatus Eremiobacteraeota bacterium]|nr:glycosyltransferase [Candidatus Eremiobacteraeota bacterium]